MHVFRLGGNQQKIISFFAGVFSITTIKKVSVKAGGSIHLPCLYESEYRPYPKYLCKGHDFIFCKVQSTNGKILISDDKKQRILTVDINDLSNRDTAWWWCAVELAGSDAKQYFHVEVTPGKSS